MRKLSRRSLVASAATLPALVVPPPRQRRLPAHPAILIAGSWNSNAKSSR